MKQGTLFNIVATPLQTTIYDYLPKKRREKKMKHTVSSLFDIKPEQKPKADKDMLWCKERGISIYELIEEESVAEFAGCTARSIEYVVELFRSVGVDVKKKMSYERFNRLCISLGIRYREEHRGVEPDFEVVKTFENGDRLIKFRNRELPVYCLGDKTFEGVKVLEVCDE